MLRPILKITECPRCGESGLFMANREICADCRHAETLTPEHKNKVTVWGIVNRAIRSGKLIRLPCEKCGAQKTDAHHDDYSKPLSVRWLCRPHHLQHHKYQAASI